MHDHDDEEELAIADDPTDQLAAVEWLLDLPQTDYERVLDLSRRTEEARVFAEARASREAWPFDERQHRLEVWRLYFPLKDSVASIGRERLAKVIAARVGITPDKVAEILGRD
jgi:hypothetical protein